jgi:hypothetical protein
LIVAFQADSHGIEALSSASSHRSGVTSIQDAAEPETIQLAAGGAGLRDL